MQFSLPVCVNILTVLKLKWSEVAQSCPTLCDPMDCSLPGSSVHWILQARILEWVAISFAREYSWPRDRTQVSCIAGRCFTVWATRERSVQTLSHFENFPCLSAWEWFFLFWFLCACHRVVFFVCLFVFFTSSCLILPLWFFIQLSFSIRLLAKNDFSYIFPNLMLSAMYPL